MTPAVKSAIKPIIKPVIKPAITPRFILSKSMLLRQYNLLKQFGTVSYSFKTNPEVGKVLETQTDCFFGIHSAGLADEIADKKRVWFFAQAWDEKELAILSSKGINKFVIDNEADLDVLIAWLEKNKSNSAENRKADVLLRMRLKENTVQTGKHFVFGMFSGEINRLIPMLRSNQSIGRLGIHFHRKTQNIGEWSLKDDLAALLPEKTLSCIDLLDIGGGYPVSYKNSHPNIEPIFAELKKLREWLAAHSISNNATRNTNYNVTRNIELMLEPGRFLSAPCIRLEAGIKNIYNNNIIIDCSVYNTALDTFACNIRLEVENELDENASGAVPYTIKGCTPCSLDIFRYKVYLKAPKKGDKIVFLNAGAYNFSTDFCSLEKVPTVVVY